ncbi:YqeG family HAD IIIA-type phosphatase [Enterococcus sp. LJL98]
MFLKYKPTWMLEAIYQITPEQLAQHGIKAVLADLDNTLIAWNNPNGTEELRLWLEKMATAGIPVIVVSNNNHDRVEKALEALELDFIPRALKPFPKGIHQALKKLKLSEREVIMVGDQLMTDIRAAHGAGVRSVLVKPVIPTDSWKTQFNRFVERRVMKQLKKQNPEMKWQGELK